VWTATADSSPIGSVVGPPVVSNSGVHVSDSSAVYSFDKATGARQWVSPDPPAVTDAIADPIANGDRVLVSTGSNVGFGGTWIAYAMWLDARTGAQVATAPSLRVTGRRENRLSGFSVIGNPFSGLTRFRLSVIDETDPPTGWDGILQFSLNGSLPPATPATLGAQRLYYAGTAIESYQPTVDVVGVRAFPLTPPDPCALPPGDFPLGPIPCPLWSTPTTGQPVTSPVLDPAESVVYVATDDGAGAGTLLALDAADGHVLWGSALGAVASADPALAEGWLYVPLANGDLVVLAAGGCGAATCPVTWRSAVGGAGVQPAVAGGLVFVGTDSGRLVALRAAGCGHRRCHPLWHRDMGGAVTGAPAVSGGRVYVGVAPDQVVALAPS
jgi:hypothetical protein